MFRLSVNKCCRYKICYQQSLNFAKFQNPRNKPILNPKNKEERAAFIQQQRFDEIHKIITSALKQRKYLSVDEWKQLSSKFNTDSRNNIEMPLRKRICDVLLKLGPPNDPVKNAQNFFKAFDVQSDLGTKRIFLTLYAKKAFLEKLSEQENIEILELLVSDKSIQFSFKMHQYFLFFPVAMILSRTNCIYCQKSMQR